MRDRSSLIDGWDTRTDPCRESGGIPTIAQYDCIMRQTGRVMNAPSQRDFPRSAAGHWCAAEAMPECLRQNQEICAASEGVEAERARI